MILLKGFLGKTNHLPFIDTAQTTQKEKVGEGGHTNIRTVRCLATRERTHRKQGDLISLKNFREDANAQTKSTAR